MNKKTILKNNYEIEELVLNKKIVGNKYFALYYKKIDIDSNSKIAFSASKKLGNAVIRNHERRVAKEITNQIISKYKGYNFLLIIKTSSCDLTYDGKKEQIKALFDLLEKKEKKDE